MLLKSRIAWQVASRIGDKLLKVDFAVIGGGSGGLAAAKAAAALGAKTVVFDYVKPSPHGSKWGLGGTCVNVGCVPKKIFHYAALIGESLHDAHALGWANRSPATELETPKYTHSWEILVKRVQDLVKKLNFSYRAGLRKSGVTYINAWATLVPTQSGDFWVKYQDSEGLPITIEAKNILVAVGGRPVIPKEIPGSELAITSDDIFSLSKPPGKTLVVGGGYIALECAGFLNGLGNPTTVAVRSRPLRAFDRQCVDKVVENMKQLGVEFLSASVSKMASQEGRITVTFDSGEVEQFDTVIYATGRRPDTTALGLPSELLGPNGKIRVHENAKVAGNVYAVGDAALGRPELTPVAVRDGELLAARLFGGSSKNLDRPDMIPTTVFTPVEYGCVGLSEEAAIERYGAHEIDSYLFEWQTLELAAVHRPKLEKLRENEGDAEQGGMNFCKAVVELKTDRVLGLHFVGPNAGEVIQGFATAMRLGMKKKDLDETIGIHPTDAEAIVGLTITKSSGCDFVAAGGCGGGKCG